jgi:hypothetical protein
VLSLQWCPRELIYPPQSSDCVAAPTFTNNGQHDNKAYLYKRVREVFILSQC